MTSSRLKKVLLIEPFYGGSHRVLVDLLFNQLGGDGNVSLVTMSAKKWPWRSRCSALHLSTAIPRVDDYVTVFASSVLNLCELIGLRPDIGKLNKVMYFHENDLIYPRQSVKERDFIHGYHQITSCLVADKILFNSHFNMNSFLASMKSYLKLMPDYRPKDLPELIRPKCTVAYFPLDEKLFGLQVIERRHGPLRILWPHRWEHDKNPEEFFEALFRLKDDGIDFVVSVLGENYKEKPDIFMEARERLSNNIVDFGFKETKDEYYDVLRSSDVVVSTAMHEFFGVAMLEATLLNCFPLCPDRLVYPEIYPSQCLYVDADDLYRKLKLLALSTTSVPKIECDFTKFKWNNLKNIYLSAIYP